MSTSFSILCVYDPVLRCHGAAASKTSPVLFDRKTQVPRKFTCAKCAGPIRRNQSSSTVACMRCMCHAITMFVSNINDPEIATISSRRLPCSGATRPV